MTDVVQPIGAGSPKNKFLSSVGSLPVAQATVEQAGAIYTWAKAQNEYLKYGLERGEILTRDAAAAISGSAIGQQVATRLEPLDSAASNKLEALKVSYPVIGQPHDVIILATRQRLGQLVHRVDYALVAKETQELLIAQLQKYFEVAKTKTSELRKSAEDQTQALMQYSKNVNLEQAILDISKAFEDSQAFISATLAGAQQTAKSTLETGVANVKNSQVLVPLHQQLENVKTHLDNLVSSVMGTLTPRQAASVQSFRAKAEETTKAWIPVLDYLLEYVKVREEANSEVPADAALDSSSEPTEK